MRTCIDLADPIDCSVTSVQVVDHAHQQMFFFLLLLFLTMWIAFFFVLMDPRFSTRPSPYGGWPAGELCYSLQR
ncbi:hypothetical protein PVAP13_5NG131281 [Panicum virgatum]|uniref:Uncharacterized protein n=1 Tax=Panicum virgatum TaxID=38727 RepID=A0A8T0RRV8_PANVG|nr:hypothetical protein PVAP13_5NG131281 [Panicum virgatum]